MYIIQQILITITLYQWQTQYNTGWINNTRIYLGNKISRVDDNAFI